ncbi:hypothetical protein [Oceanibaculum sp.]|uniref:hypothetical protein n=1 Tax=Oceanibaculum sp. TaxID=1903597 RepID=UPI0025825687|nr:hypothetical protein [Oceanibaculum sp.]MCH2394316.1 hypothetical protein [Oceanibaculum sp.]
MIDAAMRNRVLGATFTPAEMDIILHNRNFTNLRSVISRPTKSTVPTARGALLLPQEAGRGKRGEVYTFAHAIEFALHYDIPGTREEVLTLIYLAFQEMAGPTRFIRSLNKLPEKERQDIMSKCRAIGRTDDPCELGALTVAPEIAFSPEFISRDPAHPTFWVMRYRGDGRFSGFCWIDDGAGYSLAAAAGDIAERMAMPASEPDHKALIRREARCPFILNVTELILDLESMCAKVLAWRDLHGSAG